MANKRRPKKIKPPYRRYGPSSAVNANGVKDNDGSYTYDNDDEEEEEVTLDSLIRKPVTGEEGGTGETVVDNHGMWPFSKFQKVDVLKFAIIADKIKRGEVVEIELDIEEIRKQILERQENSIKEKFAENVFPMEVWNLILKFQDAPDPKYLRLSKHFFLIYLPIIYTSPILDCHNFFPFVDTLTTSKKKYGTLVTHLDLSPIIQSGKNSYVSKVLRRCSANLESFVAPQTSFGYAPLVSLHNCAKIKILDLGLVSETVKLKELFHSIENANSLTHLSFPRSSIECEGYEITNWPPSLKYLRLSGGITDDFLINSKFPSTIARLEFAHCPQIKEFAIYNFLSKCGDSLTHLAIQYPMPGLKDNSMDFLFTYCPNLLFLQITVDYCSRFLFGEDLLPSLPTPRPIKTLWIESSGGLGQSSKIHPDDLILALYEGRLPSLKNVRITSKLGWDLNDGDVETLADELEERGGGLYLNYY